MIYFQRNNHHKEKVITMRVQVDIQGDMQERMITVDSTASARNMTMSSTSNVRENATGIILSALASQKRSLADVQ